MIGERRGVTLGVDQRELGKERVRERQRERERVRERDRERDIGTF